MGDRCLLTGVLYATLHFRVKHCTVQNLCEIIMLLNCYIAESSSYQTLELNPLKVLTRIRFKISASCYMKQYLFSFRHMKIWIDFPNIFVYLCAVYTLPDSKGLLFVGFQTSVLSTRKLQCPLENKRHTIITHEWRVLLKCLLLKWSFIGFYKCQYW